MAFSREKICRQGGTIRMIAEAAGFAALRAPWRIGVDVGGTFTDLVYVDTASLDDGGFSVEGEGDVFPPWSIDHGKKGWPAALKLLHPLERDPERVLADVLDGLIAKDLAEAHYAEVFTARGDAIDVEVTRQRRAGLAGLAGT